METFGRVAPGVPVTDMDRAMAFYRDVLGFEVHYTNGDQFAVIGSGDAELHVAVRPDRAGTLHAHLMVKGLNEVHARLTAAAADIRQPPKAQPWGLRDLIVADPDGNTFEIAEKI